MTTTLTRRVVPLIGVLALLLTLLVPQTNAAFATEEADDKSDEGAADTEETAEDDGSADDGSEDADAEAEDVESETDQTDGSAETNETDLEDVESETDQTDGSDDTDEADQADDGAEESVSELTTTSLPDSCQPGTLSVNGPTFDYGANTVSFDLSTSGSNNPDCNVWVQTYIVPNTWNESGFNTTAQPQDTFDYDDVLVTATSQTVTIDTPSCGPFQWDVYGGQFLETVGTGGHHGVGSGTWLFKGAVVNQDLCEPTNLTFETECEDIVSEREAYRLRVTNDNNVDVDFTWDVYGSGAGGSGSVLANEITHFEVPATEDGTVRIFITGRDGEPKLVNQTAIGNFKDASECDVDINFQKIVCEDYSQIRGNVSGTAGDATNGGYLEWGTTVTRPVELYKDGSDLPAGCSFAEGWSFFGGLSKSAVNTAGETGSAGPGVTKTSAVTDADGIIETTASKFLNPTDSYEFVQGNKRLWIAEQQQTGYEFGALQCYRDALNPDNLDFIKFGSSGPDGDVNCVAWNVRGSIEVEPTKIWKFPPFGRFQENLSPRTIETSDGSMPPGTATIGLFVDDEEDPSAIWTIDTEGFVTDDSTQKGSYTLPYRANYEFREIDYDVEGYRCTNESEQDEILRVLDVPARGDDTIVNLCEPKPTVMKVWVDVNNEPVDAPDPSSTPLTIEVSLSDGSTEDLKSSDFTRSGTSWIAEVEEADFGTSVTDTDETIVPSGYEQVQNPEDCMGQLLSSTQESELDVIFIGIGELQIVCNRELPPTTSVPQRSLSLDAQEVCLIDDLTEVIEFETDGENITGEATLTVTNEAGQTVATYDVTVGEDGQIPWEVADDQLPFGELTLTLEARGRSATATVDLSVIAEECSEVEGEIIEDDDPVDDPDEPTKDPDEPTDEGDDTVTPVVDDSDDEVLGETITAQEEHPKTGASTLLLMLLGMLGVGFGTILLRSRRDTAEDAS